MLEISFRNGKDTFDGCSSNPLPLFVEKRVIFKMFNTLYVPPPLNNTSCICHDSRHVYNKPSNMRNISKYFQCLSIYKIDKFTNIHIHNTNMDIHYYISSILWLPSVVCLPAASRQRSSDMSSFCTLF